MAQMQTHDLSTPLAYALQYARLGWHVLPIEPGAKRPVGALVPRGMLDASSDADVLARWWAARPDAGLGIALAQSGLVAIDIDPRNGGTETFDQLQAEHGSLRSDVMAFTGGGGEHHVFLVPPGHQISLPGTLGPGVDLKANGYIVVEPSVHPSGRAYGWEASSSPLDGVVPSPLPDWLRSLRVELQPTTAQRPGDVPMDPRQARDVREALYLLDADSHDTWVQAGMALHSTGWGHAAYAIWCAWSQQSTKFDATEQRKRWASFHTDGERSLRLSFIFAQAQARGWQNPARRLEAVPAAEQSLPADLPILNLDQLREASASITWSVKHVIPADSVGVMFGGSGTFKSFIALDYALHVAHGLQWLGKKTRRGAVLFIAAEGGAGLWRRIAAWHQARGLSPDGIEFYVLPMAVSLSTQAGKVAQAAQALGVSPSVVIVDTMSQTFDGEENSANEVASYLREISNHLRALWRCVVLVIHHSGHQATERPRGSSAIRANVDFMIGVFRDEQQMLATIECAKQKDGELFEPTSFHLTSYTLGHDEDGEAINSLAARAVNNAEELLQAVAGEARAGRGGREAMLHRLCQTGMSEKELRQAFYKELPDLDIDSRKKAFYRSRDSLLRAGCIDFGTSEGSMERVLIVLKEPK